MADQKVNSPREAIVGFLNRMRKLVRLEAIFGLVMGIFGCLMSVSLILLAQSVEALSVITAAYCVPIIALCLVQIVFACKAINCFKTMDLDLQPTKKHYSSVLMLILFILTGSIPAIIVRIMIFGQMRKNAALARQIVFAQYSASCKDSLGAYEGVKEKDEAYDTFVNKMHKMLCWEGILSIIAGVSVCGGLIFLLITMTKGLSGVQMLTVVLPCVVGAIFAVVQFSLGCMATKCAKREKYNKNGLLNFCGNTKNLVLIIIFCGGVPAILRIICFIRARKELSLIQKQKENVQKTDAQLYDDAALEAEYLEKMKKQHEEDFKQPFDPDCVLEVRHLRKTFPVKKTMFGKVKKELVAVNDISFKLKAGETLGIVGESGCGKTTAGRAILKLHEPTAGQVIFNGTDITHLNSRGMRKFRKEMQIIFQDPYSSLPPRDTVGGILTEPVHVHSIVPRNQEKEYVLELMDKCGLRDYYYERYPHEFSGGQRQRICIARALSVEPKLVICDEPVSALDVSIQAQIINLLKKLQREMNLAYVFISHDLSVVKFISDKIAVLYLGNMMEYGTKEDIFRNPLHPYTKALFSAIPNPDPTAKMDRIKLQGDIPSPANPPKGCKFHTRCPYATEKCKHVIPEYKEYEPGHFAACHLLDKE